MKIKDFKNVELTFNDEGIFLGNYPVMPAWEETQIKEMIRNILEETKPKTVLEVGFGLGFTADEIQKFGVEKHYIVEMHPEIFKKAEAWAIGKENVVLIKGMAQDIVSDIEFDLIWDDGLIFNEHDFEWYKNLKYKNYRIFPGLVR